MDRRGRVKVADFGLAKIVGAERPSLPGVLPLGRFGRGEAAAAEPALRRPDRRRQGDGHAAIHVAGADSRRRARWIIGRTFTRWAWCFTRCSRANCRARQIEPPSKKVQIDVRLDEVVLRALEKKPELRYQQASELKTQVETIAATPPGSSRRESAQTEKEESAAPETNPDVSTDKLPWANLRWLFRPQPALRLLVVVALLIFFSLFLNGFLDLHLHPVMLVFVIGLGTGLVAAASYRMKLSRTQTPSALESERQKPEVEPRFSRTAIVGASLGIAFPVAAFGFALIHWKLSFVALLLLLGFIATTILGWIAVTDIRRSAGKLYGLWLAVFDGLLFPLLVVDGLITIVGVIVIKSVNSGVHDRIFDSFQGGFTRSRTGPVLPVMVGFALLLVAVDFLVTRAVWRAVKKNGLQGRVQDQVAVLRTARKNKLRGYAFALLLVIGLVEVGRWWTKYEPLNVWMPDRLSEAVDDRFGMAQIRVTAVAQEGQVVLVKFVCDSPYPDPELLVQYSGPLFDYPAEIASQITNDSFGVDCLMAASGVDGGQQKVLAGSRELKGKFAYRLGFVLPDAATAAKVVEQLNRAHFNKPRGLTEQNDLPLFSLHQTVGKSAAGNPVRESLVGMLIFWTPKAHSISKPESSTSLDASFGPVMEQKLMFNTNGVTDGLALESNQIITFPRSSRPPASVAFADDVQNGIVFIQSASGLYFAPVENRSFESLSPAWTIAAVASRTNLKGLAALKKSAMPATFAFRTGAGLVGALQVSDLKGAGNGVAVHYRFLTQSFTNAVIPLADEADRERRGTNAIPLAAAKLYNQMHELTASMSPFLRPERNRYSVIQFARLNLQRVDLNKDFLQIIANTPVETARRRRLKSSDELELVDFNENQERWRELEKQMQAAQIEEELLMSDACADLLRPGASRLQFGPWQEILLLHPSAGSNCCLAFDSGRLLTPPPDVLAAMTPSAPEAAGLPDGFNESVIWSRYRAASQTTNALARWMEDAAVDAVALGTNGLVILSPVRGGLKGADISGAADPSQRISPAWVLWKLHFAEASKTPLPPPSPTASTYEVLPLSPSSSAPREDLCYFRTRAGNFGILQITGVSDNPRGVKLRYKLVQNCAAPENISSDASAYSVDRNSERPQPGTSTAHSNSRSSSGEVMATDRPVAFEFRWVAADNDTNSPVEILPGGNSTNPEQFRVLKAMVLDERDVASAGFTAYQADRKDLNVLLTRRGRDEFAQATATNIGRRLAIVWRDRVVTAPVVRSAITGDTVSITGQFNDEEASQLLDLLNHRSSPTNAVSGGH